MPDDQDLRIGERFLEEVKARLALENPIPDPAPNLDADNARSLTPRTDRKRLGI